MYLVPLSFCITFSMRKKKRKKTKILQNYLSEPTAQLPSPDPPKVLPSFRLQAGLLNPEISAAGRVGTADRQAGW